MAEAESPPSERARIGPAAPSGLAAPAVSLPAGGAVRAAVTGRSRHPMVGAFLRMIRNPVGAIGLAVLTLLLVTAATAPLIVPFDPVVQHRGDELRIPGWPYLLGTDQLGRDILSRIIWGSRGSLLVGVIAVTLGASIGITTGLLAGFLGGLTDSIIMRFYDALLAFPAILLGMAVVAVLGPGALNVALAIAIAQVPIFARLTRSVVLTERERDYVLAARCLGATPGRTMWQHVLPNCLGPLLVQLSLAMGFSVLAESGLSFLGLGAQPPEPSWGGMLNESRAYLREAPWFGFWPGVALALLLVGLNYLSDALRDALDPRRVNVA